MADLIAIGYPDETTALAAMDEAERLQKELIIQADAVAAIIRNKEGKLRVVTNHHAVGAGATWGMFWGMLFGMLFFIPFLRAEEARVRAPAGWPTPFFTWVSHQGSVNVL
jgi:uncharacterized membrane protein